MPTICNAKDKRDDAEYSIEEIYTLKKDFPAQFKDIKPNLVCYECGVPQMTPKLGDVNEHHYSKLPKQNHAFDCYYWGDEYTQKQVDAIVQTIRNSRPSQQQVLNAFEQIQRYLNRADTKLRTVGTQDLSHQGKPDSTQSTQTNNHGDRNRKYIPRKKLTKKITKDDEDIWKIYYGEVGIEFTGKKGDYENYLVYVKSGDKMKYRISVGVHQEGVSEFDEKQRNIFHKIQTKKRKVYLMVLGKVRIHGSYNNIAVYNSQLLQIQAV